MQAVIRAVLFLAASLVALHAYGMPRAESVPGGVAIVDLGPADQPAPTVRLDSRPVMVVRSGANWNAVVGIPLATKPGEMAVDVTRADGTTEQRRFTVQSKKYPVQYLTIANQRQVDLAPEDIARYRRDRIKINEAYVTWSPVDKPPLQLDLPAYGRLSSGFGLRRYFNKKPRNPHSGIDIAAPNGTPIYAPAPGRVIQTEDFFFNGNTVFIDHGQGLLTMYNHMSRFDVAAGTWVERGQKIGEIGSTGRVTGPHLHWAVIVNRTMVDPTLFVSPDALAKLPTRREAASAGGS
jgi:murein DD-endopeptidase MepM/ murein hydrolase activator NlpD